MGAFGGAQKYVSTLSPLGSVFNSIPAPKKTDWDSTSKENKGLFLIPELTSQVGFDLLRNSVEHEVDRLVVEALSPNRKRKLSPYSTKCQILSAVLQIWQNL